MQAISIYAKKVFPVRTVLIIVLLSAYMIILITLDMLGRKIQMAE